MEHNFERIAQPVKPSDWPVGSSISLNDWDAGHVKIGEFQKAGIQLIELAWRNDTFDLFEESNQAKCSKWIDEIRYLGMDVWTLHLPYGPLFDISETDADTRDLIIMRHVRLMALAKNWNIRTVVLHPSFEPIVDEERPLRISSCKHSLVELAGEAELLGIVIAVECLPRTCLGNASAEMRELIAVDMRLGICCDVNHLLKETPESFVRELGDRIVTVHMSDNDGLDERHWLPGKGIIAWTEVIQALLKHGYKGSFMFEVRRPLPSALADCWKQLLADSLLEETNSMIERLEHNPTFAVAGHRGYSSAYPENTLLAFQEAFQLGVDMVEFDLQLSKDGAVIVMHDQTLDRTTNGHGRLSDYSLAELKQLDAGSWFGSAFEGLKIPTLKELCELLKEYPKVLLNVEIKRGDCAKEVADASIAILKEYGYLSRCVFTSFDADILEHIHDNYRLKTHGFLEEVMHNFVPGEQGTYSKMWSIAMNMNQLTREKVERFRNQGLLVWCYCPDDEEQVAYAMECGATLATCNNPLPALRRTFTWQEAGEGKK